MASIKQIGGQLEKSFAKWDYERAQNIVITSQKLEII